MVLSGVLASAVGGHAALESLKLSENQIGDEGAMRLCGALQASQPCSAVFFFARACRFYQTCCLHRPWTDVEVLMVTAFQACPKLLHLAMAHNRFGAAEAARLTDTFGSVVCTGREGGRAAADELARSRGPYHY
eukprot:1307241-Rhodomonas_salina.1